MPDDLRNLGAGLTTEFLGHTHEHHTELTSTNDRASAWARAGAPHGALVTAERQTAGRGRRGRTWSSPPGGDIYASVVVRPRSAAAGLGALGLAAAVGLREGLGAMGVPVRIKWPNDLLVAGRKVAGILCEMRWVGSTPEVVVGFGINVAREVFPAELGHATSIATVLGDANPGRVRALQSVLSGLENALDAFVGGGFAAIRDRYEPHCVVLGRDIVLPSDDGAAPRRVRALRLDTDGALIVKAGDGSPFRVEATDVWLGG